MLYGLSKFVTNTPKYMANRIKLPWLQSLATVDFYSSQIIYRLLYRYIVSSDLCMTMTFCNRCFHESSADATEPRIASLKSDLHDMLLMKLLVRSFC